MPSVKRAKLDIENDAAPTHEEPTPNPVPVPSKKISPTTKPKASNSRKPSVAISSRNPPALTSILKNRNEYEPIITQDEQQGPRVKQPPKQRSLKQRLADTKQQSKSKNDLSVSCPPPSAKSLPYTPRNRKVRPTRFKNFDNFTFRGPLPANLQTDEYSIPADKYNKALAFLEGNTDKPKASPIGKNTTKGSRTNDGRFAVAVDDASGSGSTKTKTTSLDELTWKKCHGRLRAALFHQKQERYRPTELTAMLCEMHNCWMMEDWKHLCRLLGHSAKLVGCNHRYGVPVLYKIALPTLIYDPILRDSALLDDFLYGCVGCKSDSDVRQFMEMYTKANHRNVRPPKPTKNTWVGRHGEIIDAVDDSSRKALNAAQKCIENTQI